MSEELEELKDGTEEYGEDFSQSDIESVDEEFTDEEDYGSVYSDGGGEDDTSITEGNGEVTGASGKESGGDDTSVAESGSGEAKNAVLTGTERELAELRRRLEEYDALAKSTLEKMGVSATDGRSALIKLAAETDGISEEEYLARHTERERDREARRFLQISKFNEKKARDLSEIQAIFPDTKKYKDVTEFPNFERFAYLRDRGSTAEEAYISSHRTYVTESIANSVRQGILNDTKNHLISTSRKGTASEEVMTRRELFEWREMFPDLSDREITELYRKTK